MNKGLKALERNRNFVERYFVKQVEETGVYHKDMKDAIFNDLSTIEKELKDYYEIKDLLNRFNIKDLYGLEVTLNLTQEKIYQALEIIKKYKLFDFLFVDKQILLRPIKSLVNITQQEYELLKEVLP